MSIAQLVSIVINILLTVVGVLIAFQVRRLYQAIDALGLKDSQLEKQILEHREDVLKNYTSSNELGALRDDVYKRFDRFEDNIMSAIRRIPTL